MKICLVGLNALPALSQAHQHHHVGGAEVQLAQLARALTQLGHDVRLVVGDYGQSDGAVYEGVKTLKTFKPSAGLPGVRFLYPRWTSLWAAMTRADADVYYYSCAGMTLGLLAMYCGLHGRRLVFRAASDSDCDPRTLLIKYRRDRWLYEFGLRHTDAVLVQSVTQQDAMRRNFGVAGTIVRGLVERPSSGAKCQPKDIDVLWVGSLRQLKRPERFLELAKALPEFRFHMVGGSFPGEESLYKRVEVDARMIANLTFHGKVPYLEIGHLFDRTRLLANTSEVEGFPNTFLQSWVRGVPVVTMFDPDHIVASEGLGSAHGTVAEMGRGIDSLLRSSDALERTSAMALAFMAKGRGQAEALAPYLHALTGTKN